MMGPMVDPQGESFFTMNSWIGTLANSATARNNPPDAPSVAYLEGISITIHTSN